MKTKLMAKVIHTCRGNILRHGHEILTAGCILATIGAVCSAVKDTKKAEKKIEEKKEELKADNLTLKESVQTVWTCYIPTAFLTIGSIGCALAAHGYSKGKYMSLLALAGSQAQRIAEDSNVIDQYKEWSKANKENLKPVEKTTKEGKKIIVEPPKEQETTEVILWEDEAIFIDPISEREFRSTKEKIALALLELNNNMGIYDMVTMNDLYYFLGLRPISIGDDIGWNQYNSTRDRVTVRFEPDSRNGKLCWRMIFDRPPYYGYNK